MLLRKSRSDRFFGAGGAADGVIIEPGLLDPPGRLRRFLRRKIVATANARTTVSPAGSFLANKMKNALNPVPGSGATYCRSQRARAMPMRLSAAIAMQARTMARSAAPDGRSVSSFVVAEGVDPGPPPPWKGSDVVKLGSGGGASLKGERDEGAASTG